MSYRVFGTNLFGHVESTKHFLAFTAAAAYFKLKIDDHENGLNQLTWSIQYNPAIAETPPTTSISEDNIALQLQQLSQQIDADNQLKTRRLRSNKPY
jgi:hypothetical protein